MPTFCKEQLIFKMKFSHLASLLLALGVYAADAPPSAGFHAVPRPAAFQLDGKLAEWESLHPTIVMPSANSENTISGKFWIALDGTGLAMAGKIRHPGYKIPKDQSELLSHDHIEFWMAFPEAEIPSWDTDDSIDGETLQQNNKKQNDRTLKALRRLFTRQFLISPLGIQEVWMAPHLDDLHREVSSEQKQRMSGCSTLLVKMQLGKDGYDFETVIPPVCLPASRQLPLREPKVMMDIFYPDKAGATKQLWISSSPGRKFGDPRTFAPLLLPGPVQFPGADDAITRMFHESSDTFVFSDLTEQTCSAGNSTRCLSWAESKLLRLECRGHLMTGQAVIAGDMELRIYDEDHLVTTRGGKYLEDLTGDENMSCMTSILGHLKGHHGYHYFGLKSRCEEQLNSCGPYAGNVTESISFLRVNNSGHMEYVDLPVAGEQNNPLTWDQPFCASGIGNNLEHLTLKATPDGTAMISVINDIQCAEPDQSCPCEEISPETSTYRVYLENDELKLKLIKKSITPRGKVIHQ